MLVHEGEPDFLLGNDLAFLNHQQTFKAASVQAVNRSQSRVMQQVLPEDFSEEHPDENLMQQEPLVTEPDSAANTKTEPEDLPFQWVQLILNRNS